MSQDSASIQDFLKEELEVRNPYYSTQSVIDLFAERLKGVLDGESMSDDDAKLIGRMLHLSPEMLIRLRDMKEGTSPVRLSPDKSILDDDDSLGVILDEVLGDYIVSVTRADNGSRFFIETSPNEVPDDVTISAFDADWESYMENDMTSRISLIIQTIKAVESYQEES